MVCSQDSGLPSYLRHGPLDGLGLFFFWADLRDQTVLLGLPFFYEFFVWAPNFKPHQLPPSPCAQIMWARAIIIPVSFTISTCRFGLTLIAAISRMLIMTLGFRARLFPFDDLFNSMPLWFLNFLFIQRFGALFPSYSPLDPRVWSSVFVYSVCLRDGFESLFLLAHLRQSSC